MIHDMHERNEKIRQLRLDGKTFKEIAQQYNISKQRASQIFYYKKPAKQNETWYYSKEKLMKEKTGTYCDHTKNYESFQRLTGDIFTIDFHCSDCGYEDTWRQLADSTMVEQIHTICKDGVIVEASVTE
jgi:hypothetical protein